MGGVVFFRCEAPNSFLASRSKLVIKPYTWSPRKNPVSGGWILLNMIRCSSPVHLLVFGEGGKPTIHDILGVLCVFRGRSIRAIRS